MRQLQRNPPNVTRLVVRTTAVRTRRPFGTRPKGRVLQQLSPGSDYILPGYFGRTKINTTVVAVAKGSSALTEDRHHWAFSACESGYWSLK